MPFAKKFVFCTHLLPLFQSAAHLCILKKTSISHKILNFRINTKSLNHFVNLTIEIVFLQHNFYSMKKLSFNIFVTMLFAFSPKISAQMLRYKATSFSVMEKIAKDKWGEWSAFEPSTVVIGVDPKKSRIVVNSQEIQLYKIMSFGEPIKSKNLETLILNCLDNDRGSCTIIIITHKDQDERVQFYINYDDIKMVYNVYKTE